MENNNTLDNKYDIIRRIAQGPSSRVYIVTNKIDNNQYIAKVRMNNQKDLIDFQNELQMETIASGLNNQNIVHLISHGVGTLVDQGIVTDNVNYMIFEYCPRGELLKYIMLGPLIERMTKYIFKKILLGVQALHGAGYCHRDLKLENILLDQNFNPKIKDFIFSTRFQQDNQTILLNDFIGTLGFSSPQIIANQPYRGEKADIFSLGVILFLLVVGANGFHSARKEDTLYRFIIKKSINLYWKALPQTFQIQNISEDFKNLYIRMVSFNENDRPSISEILQHHWFDEINNLNDQQANQLELEVRNEFLARWNQIQNANNNNNNNNNNNGNNN